MRDICALPRRALPEGGYDVDAGAHLVHGVHRGALLHVAAAEVGGAVLLEGHGTLLSPLGHVEGEGGAGGSAVDVDVVAVSQRAHHQAVVVVVGGAVQLVVDDALAAVEQSGAGHAADVSHQRLSETNDAARLHLPPAAATHSACAEDGLAVGEAAAVGVHGVIGPDEVL